MVKKGKAKRANQQGKKVRKENPGFGWAGALKDYKDKFTSLELQKKSLEWRED